MPSSKAIALVAGPQLRIKHLTLALAEARYARKIKLLSRERSPEPLASNASGASLPATLTPLSREAISCYRVVGAGLLSKGETQCVGEKSASRLQC
jgi:hypothetical protein